MGLLRRHEWRSQAHRAGRHARRPLLTHVKCRELHTFPGRYKPSLLSLRERSVARLAGVVEGDFRDWEAIDQWLMRSSRR